MMALLLIHCTLMIGVAPLMAQTGSWRTYMAYYEPQQIMKLDNQLFVRASNGLYSYNLNDESITTYDKMKQLNDTHITMIAKNEETKKLMVIYQNQNIDVIDSNGEVDNISALYLKSMTGDKTINSGISLGFDTRMSVTYNFGRYFISAYGQFNNIRYRHQSTHGYLNDWFINTAIGIRL